MLTAGESHGKALVAILEGLPAGVGIVAEGDRRRARAAPARLRPGWAAEVRGGPVRDPHGRAPREEPRRPGRASRSRTSSSRPSTRTSCRSRARRSRRASDPSAARARGPRGCAEVRRSTTCATSWNAPAHARPPRASRSAPAARRSSPSWGSTSSPTWSQIGSVKVPAGRPSRRRRTWTRSTRHRCDAWTRRRRSRMVAEIDRIRRSQDTVGGVFEVVAYGAPAGARLVRALRPQARRAARARADEHPVGEGGRGRRRVRVGAARTGSRAHDEIVLTQGRSGARPARAGGIEGGMTHGPADPRPRRDEAVLDRAAAARHRRPGDRHGRTSPSSSAPTSARCPRAASSARRSWPSCSPTPSWRSSAGTRWPRRAGTSRRTSRRSRDRVPGGDAGLGQVHRRPGAGGAARRPVRRARRGDRARDGFDASRTIFAAEGEAAFRELEAAALTDASMHDPAVVACGGGVVLEPANRITLRNTGVVVFLDVPLEDLRARVRPAADRPLIREEGDLERLLSRPRAALPRVRGARGRRDGHAGRRSPTPSWRSSRWSA